MINNNLLNDLHVRLVKRAHKKLIHIVTTAIIVDYAIREYNLNIKYKILLNKHQAEFLLYKLDDGTVIGFIKLHYKNKNFLDKVNIILLELL